MDDRDRRSSMAQLPVGTHFRVALPRRELAVEIWIEGAEAGGFQQARIWLDHDRDAGGPGWRVLAQVEDLRTWYSERLPESSCTPVDAISCPACGDCICPRVSSVWIYDTDCPLHGITSNHGATP